jgi:tetratricopeptide (TPR) repeat protein
MGKTALAQAFAYKEADAFPGGCWLLRCEGRDRLLTVFRNLVNDLEIELTDEEKLDDAKAVRRVFDVLRARGPALFLLDNVDHPALLAQEQMKLLADQPWARVLYSTRLAPDEFTKAGAVIRPLDLDRLPENQAVDLIRRYQPGQAFASPEHKAAAREIVRELSGLTLAVETAAVYLGQCDESVLPEEQKQHAVDVRNYLNKLREDLKTGGSEGVMNQLREVTATLRPTLARLDAPARTVLQIVSLLAPDGVALPWVRVIAGQSHPELANDAATGESDPWTQLIRGLIGMRLFQPTAEPRVVAIHRILQRVLETELPEGREQLEVRLVDHVKSRAALLQNVTNWVEARWEVEPFGALAERWSDVGIPQAAWLLSNAGARWHDLAEWSKAESLMRRALAICEASLGPEDPAVAMPLTNLAQLLHSTNRLSEAEPLMRRALAVDEAKYGPRHPNVAISLNNLAQLLRDTNQMAEGELLLRRALAIEAEHFGPDHPKVASVLSNLADLLRVTNRLAEAEPLMRRVLAHAERTFGPNHTVVAKRLGNLAELLQATNRFEEAERLMRRALTITKGNLGTNDPTVATALNNLGWQLKLSGRLKEAEELMRQALAIDEKVYSPYHAVIARDLNNLAALLQATKRLAEAEPLMRRGLAIEERNRGPIHPHVIIQLDNLAGLLRATNRFAEAESLLRRAASLAEQSFIPDHPELAILLNNLAQLLQFSERLDEAAPLMRRAVVIFLKFTRATGHPHPHLHATVKNFAGLLHAMGLNSQQVLAQLDEIGAPYGVHFGGNSQRFP